MVLLLSVGVVEEEKWLERDLARDAAILLTWVVGLLFPRAGSMDGASVDCSLDGTCGDQDCSNGKRRATAGAPEHAARERRRSICRSCVGYKDEAMDRVVGPRPGGSSFLRVATRTEFNTDPTFGGAMAALMSRHVSVITSYLKDIYTHSSNNDLHHTTGHQIICSHQYRMFGLQKPVKSGLTIAWWPLTSSSP